ncbi:hypothetical protein [Merismopedia glauca]|uniref:Uncharacterized protein n=1 Tax=Merismopedia glauca CCAP 1448/3 TaxID=1296344 RepID=A0A2T1C3C3_9CYAN|nr:hypothetical protein [Merismopedia glauca]PSB02770.1 hypothetical protein C7B64_11500 [Merismopedia glauca CCAP 1448/3]
MDTETKTPENQVLKSKKTLSTGKIVWFSILGFIGCYILWSALFYHPSAYQQRQDWINNPGKPNSGQ